MAGRYVKLDDVMDAIGGVPKKKDSPYPTPIHLAAERIVKKLKERIAKVPTADVMEVKHGKWKQGIPYVCSICGKPAPDEKNTSGNYSCWLSPYCPHCGADMRGVKDE